MSRKFYGCYLLRTLNPDVRTRNYIGFTDNPRRRIRQHNGEITGGAHRTRHGRPWEMVLVLYGFMTQEHALQFEWAWQHPAKSLAVRGVYTTLPKAKLAGLKGKVLLLHHMLQVPPWRHYPLTLQYLCADGAQLHQGCPPPPQHMQLVYGPMDTLPTALEAEEGLDSGAEEAAAAGGADLLGDTWQDGPTSSSGRGGSAGPLQLVLDSDLGRRGAGSAPGELMEAEQLCSSSCRCDSDGSLLLDSSDALSVTSSDGSVSSSSRSSGRGSRGRQQQADSQQQPKKRGRKKNAAAEAAGRGEGVTCLDLCTSSDSEALGSQQQQQVGSQLLMEMDVGPEEQGGSRHGLEDPVDAADAGGTQKQAVHCSCCGDLVRRYVLTCPACTSPYHLECMATAFHHQQQQQQQQQQSMAQSSQQQIAPVPAPKKGRGKGATAAAALEAAAAARAPYCAAGCCPGCGAELRWQALLLGMQSYADPGLAPKAKRWKHRKDKAAAAAEKPAGSRRGRKKQATGTAGAAEGTAEAAAAKPRRRKRAAAAVDVQQAAAAAAAAGAPPPYVEGSTSSVANPVVAAAPGEPAAAAAGAAPRKPRRRKAAAAADDAASGQAAAAVGDLQSNAAAAAPAAAAAAKPRRARAPKAPPGAAAAAARGAPVVAVAAVAAAQHTWGSILAPVAAGGGLGSGWEGAAGARGCNWVDTGDADWYWRIEEAEEQMQEQQERDRAPALIQQRLAAGTQQQQQQQQEQQDRERGSQVIELGSDTEPQVAQPRQHLQQQQQQEEPRSVPQPMDGLCIGGWQQQAQQEEEARGVPLGSASDMGGFRATVQQGSQQQVGYQLAESQQQQQQLSQDHVHGLVIELSSDSEQEQQGQQQAASGPCYRLSPSARLLEGSLFAAAGSGAVLSNSSSPVAVARPAAAAAAAAAAGVLPAQCHKLTPDVLCMSSAAMGGRAEEVGCCPPHPMLGSSSSMCGPAGSPEAASPAPLRQRLAMARAAAKPR